MKKIFFLAILLSTNLQTFAEDSASLDQKWNNMVGKANTYQNYKVIKITDLSSMWNLVQNHVKTQDIALANKQSVMDQQKIKIAELEKQTSSLNQKIKQIDIEKESISFFNNNVNKYTYTTLLWLFIGFTLLGAAVLFYLFKRSNKITVQKTNDFAELSKSFEEYKQSRIEVERKLKRELQTYLNKSRG